MTLYIIQSHSGELLDRHLGWTASARADDLFRTPHRDIALNQLIELNARDVHLRAQVVACDKDDRGLPDLSCVVA